MTCCECQREKLTCAVCECCKGCGCYCLWLAAKEESARDKERYKGNVKPKARRLPDGSIARQASASMTYSPPCFFRCWMILRASLSESASRSRRTPWMNSDVLFEPSLRASSSTATRSSSSQSKYIRGLFAMSNILQSLLVIIKGIVEETTKRNKFPC